VYSCWYGALLLALYNYNGLVAPRLSFYNFWFLFVLWVGVYFVVRCYLASLANCDWTLKQSRVIAAATVVGCSESSHFYLVAERCAPFLDRGRLYSCCLLFTFVSDLSGTKTASIRVTTTYYTKIMDKHLRPQTFSTPDDSASSAYRWKHWKRILENCLSLLPDVTLQDMLDMLDILISLFDSTVYEFIRECSTYEDAIACLDNVFVKPVKEAFSRHRLNPCQQKPGESIDEFLQHLKAFSVDCNFTDVSAVQCKEAAVRDDFVAGLPFKTFVSGNSLGHWWRSAFCCGNRRLWERYFCFLEQRKKACVILYSNVNQMWTAPVERWKGGFSHCRSGQKMDALSHGPQTHYCYRSAIGRLMYTVEHLRKIKNEEIMHCRFLLSEFDFDIVFHPGKLNTAPDALSHVYCAGFHRNTLYRADYTTPQIRWWRPNISLCPDNQFACRTEIHRGVHVALWLNVWPRWLLRHAFRVKYCPVTKHGSLVWLCIFRKK